MWKRLQEIWWWFIGHRIYDPVGEAYVKIVCPRTMVMVKIYPGKDHPHGIPCPDCGELLVAEKQGVWLRAKILPKRPR